MERVLAYASAGKGLPTYFSRYDFGFYPGGGSYLPGAQNLCMMEMMDSSSQETPEPEAEHEPEMRNIETGGGTYIEGNVRTGGGDFIQNQKNIYLSGEQPRKAAGPFLVEPPEGFVERPAEYEAVVARLIEHAQGSGHNGSAGTVGITAALRGAGGYGKTTLARAVCQDARVKQAYPEGALWVTLGESATNQEVIRKIQYLVGRLTGESLPLPDLTFARTRLYEALEGRRVLLVIDDVWNAALLAPFLQGGAGCGRLVTTRNDETLPPGAKKINVDEMRAQEALNLIASRVEAGHRKTIESRLGRLAERLGNWPLLLNLASGQLAALLEAGYPVERALGKVEEAYEARGLRAFNSQEETQGFDAQDPQERSRAADRALGVSVDHLSEKQKARFFELAVFPQDVEIPQGALEALWGFTGKLEAGEIEDLCILLLRRSLLQRFDPVEGTIRLHDVVRRYLVEQSPRVALLHEALLEGYGRMCPGGWGQGPKDGYFFRRLAYHLAEAGQADELEELLLDFAWMDAHLRHGGIGELLADYETGLAVVQEEKEEIRLVQRTLLMSAPYIAKDPSQLAGQLLGRMLGLRQPGIAALLEKAKNWRDGQRRLQPIRPCLNRPGDPEILTLRGHSDAINCVAISPDGHLAISGGDDNTLKVWDLTSGQERHTLEGHSEPVLCAAVSPDGSLLVSGSIDNTLKVWNLAGGAGAAGVAAAALEGHTDFVDCVAISPDGRLAVSGSEDRTLRVWELATGVELHTLKGHTDAVHAVAISPDGRWAVSGSNDYTLRVWDLETGQEIQTLEGHSGIINCVAISPDGRLAVSGANDYTLKVWELARAAGQGRELLALKGHTGPVEAVAISPDGKVVVSGSVDKTLKVWELSSANAAAAGVELRTLTGHTSHITSTAISPDGRLVVSGANDNTLKIWDLAVGVELRTLKGHDNTIRAIAISPDGRLAISGSSDQTLRVWDLSAANTADAIPVAKPATGITVASVEMHGSTVNVVAFSPDGKRVVSGANDHTLKVWGTAAAEAGVRTLAGHRGIINALAISPDGKLAVSGSNDYNLRVWDLENGREVRALRGHASYVTCAAISPDGRLVVSGSGFQDRTLKVWNLASGQELLALKGHSNSIHALAISPDGRLVVSGAHDHTVRVWDVGFALQALAPDSPGGQQAATIAAMHTLEGHSGHINAVAISPDSRRAASGSGDGTLKVWDLEIGEELHTLAGHSGPVQAAAISPDGRLVVSGSGDGTLRVWELSSGRTLLTLNGHSDYVNCVKIHPSGRWAVSGSFDKTIRVWDLKNGECCAAFCCSDSVPALAISADGQYLSAGDYGGMVYILQMVGF